MEGLGGGVRGVDWCEVVVEQHGAGSACAAQCNGVGRALGASSSLAQVHLGIKGVPDAALGTINQSGYSPTGLPT